MIERPPVAPATAVRRLARCVLTTFGLLGQRRIRLPKGCVGLQLHFADGTASKVYRETVVDRSATIDPAVLVVGFRLRVVRGQLAHALFRFESVFSTPLFVGFPGFVSKLWVAHDSSDTYRGVYEWDGATLAEDYVRTLWRVLALVCVPGSIHYEIVLGLTREELVSDPATLDARVPQRCARRCGSQPPSSSRRSRKRLTWPRSTIGLRRVVEAG